MRKDYDADNPTKSFLNRKQIKKIEKPFKPKPTKTKKSKKLHQFDFQILL